MQQLQSGAVRSSTLCGRAVWRSDFSKTHRLIRVWPGYCDDVTTWKVDTGVNTDDVQLLIIPQNCYQNLRKSGTFSITISTKQHRKNDIINSKHKQSLQTPNQPKLPKTSPILSPRRYDNFRQEQYDV